MVNDQLTIVTAIKAGCVEDVRACLAALPDGDRSPFASIPDTHNARWAVVDTAASPEATLRAGGLRSPMLVCSAVIGSAPRVWLDALLAELGATADQIWGHSPGWPSADRVGYLLAHRLEPRLAFATSDVPVHEIVEALAHRRRLVDFALKTQGCTAPELLRRYRSEFS